MLTVSQLVLQQSNKPVTARWFSSDLKIPEDSNNDALGEEGVESNI